MFWGDSRVVVVVHVWCCCGYSLMPVGFPRTRSHTHTTYDRDFVGEKLVNFLVEPKKGTKWPLDLRRFESRQAAIDVCKDLCKYQFMHRSEKRGKGDLVVRWVFVVLSPCFPRLVSWCHRFSFFAGLSGARL